MKSIAVVGKNFGDEGKGLAVDYLALHSDRPIVVRHNGGAQSGHTVQIKADGSGKERFVFHELSSGSFRNADTLWTGSFYPDIYKLGEEIEDFRTVTGFVPKIYAMQDTCITIPDDILINMALEALRGDQRHGSCGMGINECDLRTRSGYGLSLSKIDKMDAEELYLRLSDIRRTYVPQRLREIDRELNKAESPLCTDVAALREISMKFNDAASEYIQLLSNENVLKNAAVTIKDNMRYVELLDERSLKEMPDIYDTLIFESGQGLLLDRNNTEYAPHVTASDTGLDNPCRFLAQLGRTLDEVIYVSRTYVTRHGAGKLPCECSSKELGITLKDQTNAPNDWQGQLRYAFHESPDEFVAAIRNDLSKQPAVEPFKVSLFLTHLNETDDSVLMKDKRIPVKEFVELPKIKETFNRFYLSDTRFSEDVVSTDQTCCVNQVL